MYFYETIEHPHKKRCMSIIFVSYSTLNIFLYYRLDTNISVWPLYQILGQFSGDNLRNMFVFGDRFNNFLWKLNQPDAVFDC